MRTNDFNYIAPFYDRLSKLVFGAKLESAQKSFIDRIDSYSKVLIVGGGTGGILEWLPQSKQLKIDYVERSTVMLKKAKKRFQQGNGTTFLAKDVLEITGNYDVIITNFLLDCFNESQLDLVIEHLREQLNKEGEFYVTDFCFPSNQKQSVLLKLMHTFFRATSRLESKQIKDIHQHVLNAGFSVKMEEILFDQLVFSRVYGTY